jgi:DNA-binding MarR family transcriptional regulator
MRMADRRAAAVDAVLELTVLMGDDMVRGLARDGLTPSRAHLLWELRLRGPATQSALAEALRVTPRNVTGLVDALVETGFVTRQPHPSDRRATLVAFTAHGAAVTEAMADGHRELAAVLFGGMPTERFDCFVEGLGEVLGRLKHRLQQEERKEGSRA